MGSSTVTEIIIFLLTGFLGVGVIVFAMSLYVTWVKAIIKDVMEQNKAIGLAAWLIVFIALFVAVRWGLHA